MIPALWRPLVRRLPLRRRIFLLFFGLLAGVWLVLAAGLYAGYRHLGLPAAADGFWIGGVVAGFGIALAVSGIWYLFDEYLAQPLEGLAGAMRAQSHPEAGETAAGLDQLRYLGDLVPAARALGGELTRLRGALAASVEQQTTRLAAEKRRLSGLLADVPVGVVLCRNDHQLVFYNAMALDLLNTAGAVPGLARRLTDYLVAGPILHAHARLCAGADPEAASDLLCTSADGSRILAARMRLWAEAGGQGYLLTLRDVTQDLAQHAAREGLVAEMSERLRRPVAALQAMVELPAPDAAALRSEISALTQALADLAAREEACRASAAPLPVLRASDLIEAVTARAGRGVTTEVADLLLRGDGFELVLLLAHLVRRLEGAELRLSLSEEGAGALIRLDWRGAALPIARLEALLAEPLEPSLPELTGRAVLSRHGTEIWPEVANGTAALVLPLREARRAPQAYAPLSRELVYDFALLEKTAQTALADRRWEDLTFVVFDTETTGLRPDQGDAVVQIAALRIVNGRLIAREVFDTLVDPGRRVPASATAVHGISDGMLVGAPAFSEVARRFHRFAEGAVLVAHHAPFDMAFLRQVEPALGLRFDHPILDTVLVSAVVFGPGAEHSLDALSHRLGITIPEEERHTALGDTKATAEALLRMIPALQAKGIETFGGFLTEARRHGRLQKDLNG